MISHGSPANCTAPAHLSSSHPTGARPQKCICLSKPCTQLQEKTTGGSFPCASPVSGRLLARGSSVVLCQSSGEDFSPGTARCTASRRARAACHRVGPARLAVCCSLPGPWLVILLLHRLPKSFGLGWQDRKPKIILH